MSFTDPLDHDEDVLGHVGSDEVSRAARVEELEAIAHEKTKAHRRIAYWQLAAYLLIFRVSLLGWWQIEQEADARCDAGEANRTALRNLITGVGELGKELVTNGQNPTTPEQDAALKQFDEFEKDQLALIDGPVCQ